MKLLHAAASSEPGTVEPDKKTEEDDKEKDSTPDPSPDNKNIAGELYRVAMWRSHVQFTQAAIIVYCGNNKKDYRSRSVYCGNNKKDYQSRSVYCGNKKKKDYQKTINLLQ